MAVLFFADFEDGTLGDVVADVDTLEGQYVVGHDGTGGSAGLGLHNVDLTDGAGLVRFRQDDVVASVVDAGTVGVDFVRHGDYAAGTPGLSILARVGQLVDGDPDDFGPLLGVMSDGAFAALLPGDITPTVSASGLVDEDVWYQGVIAWSGTAVTFTFTRYSDGATMWEHTDTLVDPLTDRALWAPVTTASGVTLGYDADIDNAFYNALASLRRAAVRQQPRDDGLGFSSAPRIVPPSKAQRVTGGYQ